MKNLKKKVVVLTGAAGKLGREIVQELVKEGATIVAIDISTEGLSQVQQMVEAEGGTCLTFPFDLGNLEALPELVHQIEARVDQIDVLINNVAIFRTNTAFQDFSLDDIQTVLNINLIASMELTRLLLSHFLQRNHGHILNVASLAGKKGNPYDGIYSASKGGLVMWSDAIRQELFNTGIDVSVVCPSHIEDAKVLRAANRKTNSTTSTIAEQIGSCTTARVAQGIIKTLKENRSEVVICRGPIMESITKLVFAINQIFPRFGDNVSRRLGLLELNRRPMLNHSSALSR